MEAQFRLVVVDSARLQRECLAAQLKTRGMAVEVAWDLPSLLAALDISKSTIVLVNRVSRGVEPLLQVSLRLGPSIKVVVYGLSVEQEPEIVAAAEAGAAGLLLESESFEHLLDVLRTVSTGHARCSAKVSAILLQRVYAFAGHSPPDHTAVRLTTREAEIAEMVAKGLTNQQIASRLTLSLPTVKNHVHRLLTKLGVASRADIATIHRTVKWGAHQRADVLEPEVSSETVSNTSEQSSW